MRHCKNPVSIRKSFSTLIGIMVRTEKGTIMISLHRMDGCFFMGVVDLGTCGKVLA